MIPYLLRCIYTDCATLAPEEGGDPRQWGGLRSQYIYTAIDHRKFRKEYKNIDLNIHRALSTENKNYTLMNTLFLWRIQRMKNTMAKLPNVTHTLYQSPRYCARP